MGIASWVVLALLVGLLILAVNAYNGLVRLRNEVANALGQIDVQLKRRYDLIPNLVETAKKYLEHEKDTLAAVISARNTARNAAGAVAAAPAHSSQQAQALGALGAAEQALGGSLGKLMAVVEAYPELKADQTIRDLQTELSTTENRIGFARQAYNDVVLEFNNATAQFPDLLVAKICSFVPAAMLQSTQNAEERQAPRVQM